MKISTRVAIPTVPKKTSREYPAISKAIMKTATIDKAARLEIKILLSNKGRVCFFLIRNFLKYMEDKIHDKSNIPNPTRYFVLR
jgi:hypothetical protein